MTKQEQIEEMAKFMHYKAHGKDKDCDNEKCEMCWCSCKNDAELLYNAGYRKIDDNCLVLSREEYDTLKTENDKYVKNCIDYIATINKLENKVWEVEQQARKETAEKLLNDFKLWAREYQYKDTVVDENGERPMTNNEKLNYLYTYLCDKYKIEIKE